MDIIRKIGNPFKGLLSLASVARKEPESYVPGYDLYTEMPDSMVKTPTQAVSYTHLTLPTIYSV